MYDILIIGGGIVGTSIARELSRYQLKTILLEKENDIANGTTKANTALVHAGYDAPNGTLMAKFNVEGNKMYEDLCKELHVPFKKTGSLVLGFNEEDRKHIESLYENGQKNGVPEMEILEREDIKKLVPNVSDEAEVALYAKTGGIVGPWELAVALMENAMDNGVELELNQEVIDIKNNEDHYIVKTRDNEYQSKIVINAAGLYSDKINDMVSENKFKITPVKGQYYLLDKRKEPIVDKVIFQCPTPDSKGIVVTPTVHGNVLVGPDSQPIEDKKDKNTNSSNLEYIKEVGSKSIKNIPFNETITSFAGLRASPSTNDFIIGEAEDADNFINVAGIKSPGLTAAPAIGVYIKDLVVNDLLSNVKENMSFNPSIKKPIIMNELTFEEREKVIKENPSYGKVVCRCENITEGEIIDSIKRNAGARTVDGVKRRVRAGMGRCQGGFCLPRVMEILSDELDISMEDVVKDGKNSNILTEETK